MGGIKFELIKSLINLFKEDNKNKESKKEDKEDDEPDLELSVSIVMKNFKLQQVGVGLNFCEDILKLEIPVFIIYLVSFPYLQLRIIPKVGIEFCTQIALETNYNKDNDAKDQFILDFSLGAEVSVSLEIGLYIPPFNNKAGGVLMSISLGIKGILGSGKLGVELSILLNDQSKSIQEQNRNKNTLVTYVEFKAIQFYAYMLFKIEINMGFLKYSFQFYLFNELIFDPCKKCKGKKKISRDEF